MTRASSNEDEEGCRTVTRSPAATSKEAKSAAARAVCCRKVIDEPVRSTASEPERTVGSVGNAITLAASSSVARERKGSRVLLMGDKNQKRACREAK